MADEGRSFCGAARHRAQVLQEADGPRFDSAVQHDTFSRNTRNQLRQVFDALRELMTPPEPAKRPIGFVTHEDEGKRASKAKGKTPGRPRDARFGLTDGAGKNRCRWSHAAGVLLNLLYMTGMQSRSSP